MEFKTTGQETCYKRVTPMMKELFGESARFSEDSPTMAVSNGSAFATVRVLPWRDDAIVHVRAWVVTGVDMTPDLMQFLLRTNCDVVFGAFGLDDEDDIFFDHTIVGSTCDKNELRSSILAVVSTADKYDDEIVAKWGGQRAIDRKPD